MRFVSPSANRVFGYDPSEMVGRPIATLLHPDDRERAATLFEVASRTPGVTGPVEWRFRQPDGSWLSAEILATNLTGDPTVRGIVLNTRDVSERKRLEEQLTHQAFHDPLTGLANRALFRDRVSHALALAQRAVPSDHGPLPGPRRLQAGERQPGPRRGRPPAHLRGGAVPLLRPRGRHRRPAGRRRVRDPDRARGGSRRPGRAARAARDRDEPSVHPERQPGAGHRQHRRRHRGRRRDRRRPAAERRRRDVRRQAPGQGSLGDLRVPDVRRRPAPAGDGGRAPRRRSTAASSPCTTSRSSSWAPGTSTASRRWSAGSTRPTATSSRSTSSRWRRRPGSS